MMKNRIQPPSAYRWAAMLLFAFLAAYLTIRSTSLYGAGLSPDSTAYIRLARDISHNGFAFLFQGKAISQPPGYPMALAAVSTLTGMTVPAAATWINVPASAALVVLMLLSVWRVTPSLSVLIITGLMSCFSIPLTYVWSMAWSEPLFILTVTLIFLVISRTRLTALTVFFAGLLTAGACLTRYAGIVLLPVLTAFVFLSKDGNVWKRCSYAALFVLPPTGIVSLYAIRNYVISGTLLGGRPFSKTGFAENADLVTDVILAWILPGHILSFETYLLAACAILGAVTWHHREHVYHVIRRAENIVFVCAAFCIVYTGFLVWSSTTTAYDAIDDRLLSPIYPSLLVLLAVLLKPGSWRRSLGRNLVLGTFCILFAATPLLDTCAQINRRAGLGAGGYNTRPWHTSGLVAYFQQNGQPRDEILYSNAPDALYILADIIAETSPAVRHYNSEQVIDMTQENVFDRYPGLDGAVLVWCDQKQRDYLMTPDDLEVMCHVEAIKEFPDGTLYKIQDSRMGLPSAK